MKASLQEQLAGLAARYFEVDPGEVRLERTPTGKFNTTCFVSTPRGEAVLRVAPPDDTPCVFYERNMMAQEPGIHRLLRETTDVPVAEILRYDTSRALIERDYLLMERLPGVPVSQHPGLTRAVYDRALLETGRCLAQIHTQTAEQYGYLGEHRPMEPQASWPDAFRVMWNRMIDDIVDAGYYDAPTAAWMRELFDRHVGVFERPVVSRLLHMDVWFENILIDESGRVTGLVDFDRALWGDPEIDFAVLDYCGISEPAFWEGYGAARDTSPEARVRQVFYLLYELQKYIVIRALRYGRPELARQYQADVLRLARQL